MVEALFVLWTLLSVLVQFESSRFRKWNFYGFVADCRFFSPYPVTHDYIILFKEDDGSEEFYKVDRLDKPWYSFAFCPMMRLDKGIATNVRQVLRNLKHENLPATYAYLRLLNLVSSEAKNRGLRNPIVFHICYKKGFESETLEKVYTSKRHALY